QQQLGWGLRQSRRDRSNLVEQVSGACRSLIAAKGDMQPGAATGVEKATVWYRPTEEKLIGGRAPDQSRVGRAGATPHLRGQGHSVDQHGIRFHASKSLELGKF